MSHQTISVERTGLIHMLTRIIIPRELREHCQVIYRTDGQDIITVELTRQYYDENLSVLLLAPHEAHIYSTSVAKGAGEHPAIADSERILTITLPPECGEQGGIILATP